MDITTESTQGQPKASFPPHGVAQLTDLHILEMPDVPVRGTIIEIAGLFGGVDELKEATRQLQNLIYAAKTNEEEKRSGDLH